MEDATTTTDGAGGVSIDALLARIRQFAQARAAAVRAPDDGTPAPAGADGVRDAMRAQTELNRSIVQSMDGVLSHLVEHQAHLDDVRARLEAGLVALREESRAALGEIERRLQGELNARIERVEARIEEIMSRLTSAEAVSRATEERVNYHGDELRMRVLRAERRLRALADVAADRGDTGAAADGKVCGEAGHPSGNGHTTAAAAQGSPVAANDLNGMFDYFMFEHRFRGSVSDIRQRQTGYLELFRGRDSVVDLGCGRGEFVELLREHGIRVTGVDSNEDMVDFCRDRGLPVVRADLFEYLTQVPDGSLGGLFAAQVVEHLPPEQILRLIDLCGRKLEPKGVMVLETINPNCPEAMNWFYLDPSHVRPVPAELLRFMAEQEGFRVQCVRFSAPAPRIGQPASPVLEVSGGTPPEAAAYQDYALISLREGGSSGGHFILGRAQCRAEDIK